jgi:4-amino-4-deoxy-L-arabinose transferase-like glycosyltransferase
VALFRALRELFAKGDDRILFLTLWFLVIFLFFSTASSKLPTYILPLFPAVSCLVGLLWFDLLKTPTPGLRRGFLFSFVLLFGILIAATFCLWLDPFTSLKVEYGLDLPRLKFYAFPFIGAFIVSFTLFLKKHLKASFLTLVGAIVSAILFCSLVILPIMDPYRSTRGLARKLDQVLAPGEKLVLVRVMRDSALFYTNRKALLLNTRKELTDFLGSPERVYCIIKRSLFESNETFGPLADVVDQEGHKVILSNKK